MTTLRRGDHGPAVRDLQIALGDATFAPGPSDGVFGPDTDAAVRRFQAREGLTVDGIAGPATLARLRPLGSAYRSTLAPRPDGWTLGIDVSDVQGELDAPALAAAGVQACWIKISDGIHDGQRHADENARGLRAAGIDVGFYGVLEPYGVARVEPQVANFLRRVKATGAVATLPPWCDFELGKGLTGSALLESAAEWCERVEAAGAGRPMLYSYPAFIAGLVRLAGGPTHPTARRLARFPLAIAHYGTTAPSVPAPWTDWVAWQASGDPAPAGARPRPWAHLPGRPGVAVDVDYYRGTVAELRALRG